MIARSRLNCSGAVEALSRLEELAAPRPALRDRLRRLREYLSGVPVTAREFPLLAAAQAVAPDDLDPVAGFREFRRTVAEFVTAQGIDFAIVTDGQKRAAPSNRVWWFEATDTTDRKLSDLSAASTAGLPEGAVVPAYGRRERDGKTVLRTYLDIAPADRRAAKRCVDLLVTRLRGDRDYFFELIPEPQIGEDSDKARADALKTAHVVVVFLSPAYLTWSTDEARGRHRRGARESGADLLVEVERAKRPRPVRLDAHLLCRRTGADRSLDR